MSPAVGAPLTSMCSRGTAEHLFRSGLTATSQHMLKIGAYLVTNLEEEHSRVSAFGAVLFAQNFPFWSELAADLGLESYHAVICDWLVV